MDESCFDERVALMGVEIRPAFPPRHRDEVAHLDGKRRNLVPKVAWILGEIGVLAHPSAS